MTEDEKDHARAARRRRNDCYQIAFCYLKVHYEFMSLLNGFKFPSRIK